MSLYGSTQRLPTMEQRSNSRQDLASQSFRNDVFVGGNGYQGEYAAGGDGYTYGYTYSKSSMQAQPRMQVSVGGAGGAGGGGGSFGEGTR